MLGEDTFRSPAPGHDSSEKSRALALTTGTGGKVGSEAALGLSILDRLCSVPLKCPVSAPPAVGQCSQRWGGLPGWTNGALCLCEVLSSASPHGEHSARTRQRSL